MGGDAAELRLQQHAASITREPERCAQRIEGEVAWFAQPGHVRAAVTPRGSAGAPAAEAARRLGTGELRQALGMQRRAEAPADSAVLRQQEVEAVRRYPSSQRELHRRSFDGHRPLRAS